MDNVTPTVPNQTPTESPKPKFNKWIGIVGGALIVIAASGAWYWMKTTAPVEQSNQQMHPTSNSDQPTDQPTSQPEYSTFDQQPDVAPQQEAKLSGLVTWHVPQVTHVMDKLFILPPTDPNYQYYAPNVVFKDIGTFNSGPYQGQHIISASLPCDGPCLFHGLIVTDLSAANPKYTILENYSDPMDNIDSTSINTGNFLKDTTTSISELNPPQTLSGGSPKQTLQLTTPGGFQSTYNEFSADKMKLVFNDPQWGSVYTSPEVPDNTTQTLFTGNGFYVMLPDWNTAVYKVTPDFVGTDNVPNAIWTSNTQNHVEYQYQFIGGCGFSNFASVVYPDQVSIADLAVSGRTSNGDKIYEFKDPNAQMLKDMYNNDYHPYNSQTYQDDPSLKVSYDKFTADHPMFFWVDPFGRMIQFKNKTYEVTQAECGKPVIYLYPTKTENVSVGLNPVGGFKTVVPPYTLWQNIQASPDGTLMVNNQTYPYLFWEGWGGYYQMPDRGFVVAAADVDSFLTQKLTALGLNAKESADFKEYWEPYLTGSPYYFITFMGNQTMDQVAPMTVSPKPDTVIRVLMDYRPLQAPIPIQGFAIKTPVREGFTVVEWGGVKH